MRTDCCTCADRLQNCGDVLTKKKLDPHRNQCYGASFTCLDCMVHFQGNDYRSHTSCMSEAQKYQGHLYKGEKKGKGPQKSVTIQESAIIPRKAYVEDEVDGGAENGTIAVIDVPPQAPSPPPAAEDVPDVNVFDFLVTEETPRTEIVTPAGHTNGTRDLQHHRQPKDDDGHYVLNGYSYGDAPLELGLDRYDSWASLHDPRQAHHDPAIPHPPYVTPGPKRERNGERSDKHKSDKKRKRHQLEELDMSRVRDSQSRDEVMTDAPPILHSGLTGGLNRLLSRAEDYYSTLEVVPRESPSSPLKRSKKEKTDGREERRIVKSSSKHHDDRHDDDRGRDSLRKDHHERRRKHRHRHRDSSDEEHARPSKSQRAIEYRRSASAQPMGTNQMVAYHSPAELFMSFVNKGPDSERGVSINKALKRYHREREVRGEDDRGDKELWKELRVRKNERGEIVLFM